MMENVWDYSPAEGTTVLALDLAAVTTVADNPREMRAKTARQTASVPALLSAAPTMSAVIRVLGHLSVATFLVIVKRVREIATMTGNVKALWCAEVTTVMVPDSAAGMIVAKN